MLELAGTGPAAGVIDVGGGASPLVDHLLGLGYGDLTVLDVAPAGLAIARRRLGEAASGVRWLVADLRSWRPQRTYDVWHDRAVLHFMVSAADRAAYLAALTAATAPGGVAVLGCFAPEGPEQCSGQPVHRSDAAGLQATLGAGWRLLASAAEDHRTPDGRMQPFTWAVFRRTGASARPSADAPAHEDQTTPTGRTTR